MVRIWLTLACCLCAVVCLSACDSTDSSVSDGDADVDGPANDGEAVVSDGDLDIDLDREVEEEAAPFVWPRCDHVTGETTLLEKAQEFDQVAIERHVAGDGLLRNIRLAEDLQTVELFEHAENTILWSGMYLASQALRFAVTGESQAQQNARIVVDALLNLTRVTGVVGLYGRSMADPAVAYPAVAADNPGWTDSPVEGFEGWRYRNDVSKDGYAGLMFGYAIALEHFTDEALLDDIRQRVQEIVVEHLVPNGLQLIDADGIVTEHGRLFYTALDDYPGFNALLASSWVKVAAENLGDEELDAFYHGCLMQTRDDVECPEIDNDGIVTGLNLGSYLDAMEARLSLFLGDCKQNYDNFDMCYQAMYPLLRAEDDPAIRLRLREVLRNGMLHTENPEHQSIAEIGNSFFTFAYAALTGDGPDDAVLAQAVDEAVCTLKKFPAEKFIRAIPAGEQAEVCRSRLDNPCAAEPIPLAEYPFDNYLWRLDFFEINQETIAENRQRVYSPEDYLMAYWLGRYHGLIDESM